MHVLKPSIIIVLSLNDNSADHNNHIWGQVKAYLPPNNEQYQATLMPLLLLPVYTSIYSVSGPNSILIHLSNI